MDYKTVMQLLHGALVSPTLDTGITPDSEKKKNLKNIRKMVLAGIPILIQNPRIQQTKSTQGLIYSRNLENKEPSKRPYLSFCLQPG